jgi:hypothetical protein
MAQLHTASGTEAVREERTARPSAAGPPDPMDGGPLCAMRGQTTIGFVMAGSEKVNANSATSPLALASLREFGRLRSSVE